MAPSLDGSMYSRMPTQMKHLIVPYVLQILAAITLKEKSFELCVKMGNWFPFQLLKGRDS